MVKATTGYKILMLMTNVDGKAHPNEDLVIRNWLIQEFQFAKNLDDELDEIAQVPVAEYEPYLQKQMDIFYQNSTAKERNNLLQFAMNVIKADGEIVKGENKLFDQLFDGWNEAE
jgi:uncharacterized tellurite resistance protein B-like protein